MAVSRKPLFFCVLIAFIFAKVTSEPPAAGDSRFVQPEDQEDQSLEVILDQLKSKISSLESSIDERTHKLRSQDDRIRLMEKIIEEKSRSISLLQSEIESQQPEGSIKAKEQARLAHIRIAELEKQLQEINKEQKIQLVKTEHELQLAQGERPPNWLAVHFEHFQHYMVTLWNKYGRQDLEVTLQKVLEKKTQVGKWIEHHIRILAAKWIPKLKEQVLNSVTDPEVRIQSLIMKTVELYHGSKSYVIHHVLYVQKLVYPYIKEMKKFAEPYIIQVATVMKPQYGKVIVVLKVCTIKIYQTFKDFVKAASAYNHQVQYMLKDNELTRPLATMELAWFLAAALWALPVIIVFRLYSTLFSKRAKKRIHGSHISLSHRRKRSHPSW